MEAVAGPVGEALIMTAFGLFVAIPAVLAYNFFCAQNRLTYAQFDEFAHDLHDFFATGSRVESRRERQSPRGSKPWRSAGNRAAARWRKSTSRRWST